MDKMDVHMDELSQNHEVLVSRTEDLEDDMQVAKIDIDVMKIEMSSYRQDVANLEKTTAAWEASVKDVEMSVDNTHLRLEKVEDRVDAMVSSMRSVSSLSTTNAHALGLEIQHIQVESRMQLDGFFKKFERCPASRFHLSRTPVSRLWIPHHDQRHRP
jgi:chromosome segregation ATPase